ncbi:MAG: tetratricopeptide repeat protein [Armatimonadetes bacterium]|nr:tetratricopeptide repeat protein [Armatimonadota bacterium]
MEMNPDDPLYPAVLGSMLASTGDISGARSAYERAIQSAGADPSYQASLYMSLSGISEREGKLPLALEEMKKAASLAPGDWQYQSLLAGLHTRAGDPREAIKAYDIAISALLEAPSKITSADGRQEERDRILSRHYAIKASLHQLLKEDKEALEALSKAASLDRTNPQIFLTTATMALRRAEMDAFFQNIGTVVRLLEGMGAQGQGATLQLAYLWHGDAAKASALGNFVLRLLGLSETYLGNFREGKTILERFLGADSPDPHTRGQTLAFLGYLEMRIGKWKEAEERLQASLTADPSLWSSHALLAALYYDPLAEPDKGVASLQKALELAPGDPDALGGSLLARRLDPGDPLAPYLLAVVYLSASQKDKGKETLEGIPQENLYKNLRLALEKMP